MMDLCLFWERMSESFFSDENMLAHVPIAVGSRMSLLKHDDIAAIIDVAPPSPVVPVSTVLEIPVMAVNKPFLGHLTASALATRHRGASSF